MSDNTWRDPFNHLERRHDVLAENVRLTQINVAENRATDRRDIDALKKAQTKLTIYLVALATGGSAVGSGIVNFLLRG